MSDKKGIFIPIPEGYEQCEPIDASHLLVDGWTVCELIGGGRRRIMDPVRPHGETYTDQLGPRITAYLREIPKPERFRAVLDIEAESVEPRGLESNWKDFEKGVKCVCFAFREDQGIRPGQLYRVIIEEIDSDGVEILAKEMSASLREIAQREVLKPSKENYDV